MQIFEHGRSGKETVYIPHTTQRNNKFLATPVKYLKCKVKVTNPHVPGGFILGKYHEYDDCGGIKSILGGRNLKENRGKISFVLQTSQIIPPEDAHYLKKAE